MKEPGSILRIKQFSDSEEDEPTDDMEEDQQESQEPEASTHKQKEESIKKRKKGIIYISSIPKHMNVAICRELMERFGDVGRIFLQPDSKGSE